jgi:hypothetical protein
MALSREERQRGYRLERYFTHCEASMVGESPYHYRKGALPEPARQSGRLSPSALGPILREECLCCARPRGRSVEDHEGDTPNMAKYYAHWQDNTEPERSPRRTTDDNRTSISSGWKIDRSPGNSYADPIEPVPKPQVKTSKQKLSEVGDTSAGILACPKCKGTSFKAKRSLGAKLVLGTAGVVTLGVAPVGVAAAGLAKKTRVKCTTCGTEYKRG